MALTKPSCIACPPQWFYDKAPSVLLQPFAVSFVFSRPWSSATMPNGIAVFKSSITTMDPTNENVTGAPHMHGELASAPSLSEEPLIPVNYWRRIYTAFTVVTFVTATLVATVFTDRGDQIGRAHV